MKARLYSMLVLISMLLLPTGSAGSLIHITTHGEEGSLTSTASVWYTAPSAQGSGNGSSWADACTLQTALAGVQLGDEIWVKRGVHKPTATSDRTVSFVLQNGVAVYGGYAGTETSRNQRNWSTNVTILSGDIESNDTNTDGNFIAETPAVIQGNNSYHVVSLISGIGEFVLDGFVITAGQANSGGPNDRGGGMYNRDLFGKLTLTNITFSGNTAQYAGGGMYNFGTFPMQTIYLTDITFRGNTTQYAGGGMYNSNTYPTLTNITFHGNSAAYYGGGMYHNMSGGWLTNAIFYGNTAQNSGGGLYDDQSLPLLANVTFYGNSAALQGGGICHTGNNVLMLRNAILWGNSAGSGPEIHKGGGFALISYSDIQGCGGSSSWNSACGTNNGGNIDADPLFVAAVGGDLRLGLNSPAIDAGDNAAVAEGVLTDLDHNPRFVNITAVVDTGSGTPPIIDMGAYETRTGETGYRICLPVVQRTP